MTETQLKMVPFAKLVALDEINARGKTKEGIDELAASIAAKGLIQPLAVRPGDGGKFQVIDGRRRYMAIAKLVKDGTLKKSDGVPVIERNEDDSEALETSLMANTVRLPMHPVDQHVVFDRLVRLGRTESEIAARFGVNERTVKQHLALGRLAPKIREAWKNEKISADVAKAFARHENQDVQTAHFEKLRKEYGSRFGVHQVIDALTGKRIAIARCPELTLVGVEAYTAAGGKISEDLFDDEKYIDDVPLLQKLAADKIKAKCAELVADGWSFAVDAHGLRGSGNYFYSWDNVKDDAENEDSYDLGNDYNSADWSTEEKSRSGCVLELEPNGTLHINAGLIRPATADIGSTPDDDLGDEDDDEFDDEGDELEDDDSDAEEDGLEEENDAGDGLKISGVLMRSVSETLTMAAAASLQQQPDIALRVAVATLMSNGHERPAKLTSNGWPADAMPRMATAVNFDAIFQSLSDTPLSELLGRFGVLVSNSLDMRNYGGAGPNKHDKALIAAIDGNAFTLEARKAFNAIDYFARASKAVSLAAIDEIREAGLGDGLAPEDVIADMKKTALAEVAGEFATRSGWLPPELRHPTYELDLRKIPVVAE